jgi:hypothetical protein
VNRRRFLGLLAGAGAASATSYFFAPVGGWHPITREVEYIRLRPGSLHAARWWLDDGRDGIVRRASQATIYMTPGNYAKSMPYTPEIYVSMCRPRPGTEFRLAPGEAKRWRKEAQSLRHLTPVQLHQETDAMWNRSFAAEQRGATVVHMETTESYGFSIRAREAE